MYLHIFPYKAKVYILSIHSRNHDFPSPLIFILKSIWCSTRPSSIAFLRLVLFIWMYLWMVQSDMGVVYFFKNRSWAAFSRASACCRVFAGMLCWMTLFFKCGHL